MRNGYIGELDARGAELDSIKALLEGLYMMEATDAEIEANDEQKAKFTKAFQDVESLFPKYASTVRTVKLAIETYLKSIHGNHLHDYDM